MPPVYLWTALWCLNTEVHSDWKRNAFSNQYGPIMSADERFSMLNRVVDQAWTYFFVEEVGRQLEQLQRERPLWGFLFAAPEYYFAKSNGRHAIDEHEKTTLVEKLAALTLDYPKMLLVPGTIAWRKPLRRPLSRKEKDKLETRYERFRKRVYGATDKQIALTPHRMFREDFKHGLELPDPETEYTLFQEQAAYLKKQRDRTLSLMQKNFEASPEKCYTARNTAYAFSGGREVGRYQKRSNFSEVFLEEQDGGFLVFEPGGGPDGRGNRFSAFDLTFGIEICLDHQWGYLRYSPGAKPDVHVVVSAQVDIIDSYVQVQPGGFLVHASSTESSTGVYDDTGTKIRSREVDVERGTLFCNLLKFNVDRWMPESDDDHLAMLERT